MPLDVVSRELRTALIEMQIAASQGAIQKVRQSAVSALTRCAQLKRTIVDQKAANPCRRVLRDLETLEKHLSRCKD